MTSTNISSFCLNRKEKIASRCLVICVGIAKFDKSLDIPDIDDIKVDIESYTSTFGHNANYTVLTNRTDRMYTKEELSQYFTGIFLNNLYESNSGCIHYNALIITLSGHCTKNSLICSDGEPLHFTEILSTFTRNWRDRNLIANLPKLLFVDGARGYDYTLSPSFEEKEEDTMSYDMAHIEAQMMDHELTSNLEGTYSAILCSSSAVLDSQAFSGQLGWNITQIFNEHLQNGTDTTFYEIIRDLKYRLHEVASYSNYQFAVDFLEHDMDIDDVVFPSKFIKSPVMTPTGSKMEKMEKTATPKSFSFKSPRAQSVAQSLKSPLLSTFDTFKLGNSRRPPRSPRERLSAFRKSTSSTLKSLKNRKKKTLNPMNSGHSVNSVKSNEICPSSPVSHSVHSLHSVTHSNSRSHHLSQSGSISFSPMTPSAMTPLFQPINECNAMNEWNGLNSMNGLNPMNSMKLGMENVSQIQQIYDVKTLSVEQPAVLDYEGMDGWGQRMVVLSRNKTKTKVLMEWTFTMDGESYIVGLLHSQKSNPYLKATIKLVVNGRPLYAHKSTATQFFVQPQDDLVLGLSIMLDEEEGFMYSMEINGKQHERYFEEWKAVQNLIGMQMFLH